MSTKELMGSDKDVLSGEGKSEEETNQTPPGEAQELASHHPMGRGRRNSHLSSKPLPALFNN